MSHWLSRWVRLVTHRPLVTLAALLALTLLFGWFAADRFAVDTEMSNLIRQDAPWRDHYEDYKDAFPDRHDTIMVVVSGASLDATERATEALTQSFTDDGGFAGIFAPLADPFFDRNALLFLTLEQLEDLIDRLAAAQPVLAAVGEGRGLAGILDVAARAIRNEEVAELDAILEPLAESAEDIAAGGDGMVSWRDRLFADDDTETYYSLIFFGKPDGETISDRDFVARTRAAIDRTDVPAGIDVRVSGAIALSHEEIDAAQEGVRIAGIVSVVLLAAILYLGVGSLRIILATAAMLAVGVIWTAAWGLLAVGHFNPLSLIFAVVFFGLGVDFAIHYALRFQEALTEHSLTRDALQDAARTVGGAIMLCALTTALGFLAFVPTAYQGVSQLGIIAAGGMLVAAALTMTLLPALLCVLGRPRASRGGTPRTARLAGYLLRARVPVLATTAMLAVLAALAIPRLGFDHSVLALKNPESESMRVLRELQQEGVANDYTISILVDDVSRIAVLEQALEALPEVDEVESPFDFLPQHQDDKLFLLEDIDFMLGDALYPSTIADDDEAQAEDALPGAIAALLQEIEAAPHFDAAIHHELQRLSAAMRRFDGDADALRQWDTMVNRSLERELEWLRQALQAEQVGFEDLPASLRARLHNEDRGLWHLSVLPAENIGDSAALTRYVEAVHAVVPEATGRPVLEWGLGELVLSAFVQALLLALAAVTAVLMLSLRNLLATLFVLLPLALAALYTVGLQVLFGMPLNMANILVLPLIFGLGVGNGIHMVQRYRKGQQLASVLSSSTPRAVLLSALTTIGAFAALSLSPHHGTASIGMLLTIAVALLLLTVVFLLPVFLASFGQRIAGKDAPR